jgi:acrylyl-CoA reductase (NADPH)
MSTFRRLSVKISESGLVSREIEITDLDTFHTHNVLIKVAYSSLNYKDALSAFGNKGISRFYPHTPGIDASGTVVRSKSSDFKAGDRVIVTGFDLGMNTKGGFSEYISVPAHWVVPLPQNLSLKEAMIFGTAGLTAAMSIDRILNSNHSQLPIVVSGATGGVGSLSLMILKKLGIPTIAYSRRPETLDYLRSLGAGEVIHGFEDSPKPMLKGIYAAGIDTVGGSILESIIKSIEHNGSVAACGMALSSSFTSSVFPFILRGISLYGIDSAEADMEWRKELWAKLAKEWKPENLESISRTVTLDNLEPEIQQMLDGKALGRVVVELNS